MLDQAMVLDLVHLFTDSEVCFVTICVEESSSSATLNVYFLHIQDTGSQLTAVFFLFIVIKKTMARPINF
jgi:hypothetical protein